MLNLKKILLPTFLAASILLPTSAYAQSVKYTAAPNVKNQKNIHSPMIINLNNLEKYVPGANTQIKQIVSNQISLSRQLESVIQSKLGVDTTFLNDLKKIMQDIQNKIKSGQMTQKEASKYRMELIKKFNKEHATDFANLRKARQNFYNQHKDIYTSRTQAGKQIFNSRKALNEALKTGDSTKIQTSYNDYLDNLNALNNLLQSQINSLK